MIPVVDVKNYLDSLGIYYKDKGGHWLSLRCLFDDHDDANPSFFINTKSLAYNCFGCNRSGTWSSLCELMGWDVEHVAPVVDQVGKLIWNFVSDSIQNYGCVKEKQCVFPMPINYVELLPGTRGFSYMVKRGFNEKTLRVFEIGYSSGHDPVYDNYYYDRIVMPVHDQLGKFVWAEGRALGSSYAKYWRPKGVIKENFLYNFHRVSHKSYVVLVEGIIDAMQLHQWRLPSVATFGSSLSDAQCALLISKFSKIFWCHDIDKAGIGSWKKNHRKLTNCGSSLFKINIPRGKDANTVTKDEFINFMKNAKSHY